MGDFINTISYFPVTLGGTFFMYEIRALESFFNVDYFHILSYVSKSYSCLVTGLWNDSAWPTSLRKRITPPSPTLHEKSAPYSTCISAYTGTYRYIPIKVPWKMVLEFGCDRENTLTKPWQRTLQLRDYQSLLSRDLRPFWTSPSIILHQRFEHYGRLWNFRRS